MYLWVIFCQDAWTAVISSCVVLFIYTLLLSLSLPDWMPRCTCERQEVSNLHQNLSRGLSGPHTPTHHLKLPTHPVPEMFHFTSPSPSPPLQSFAFEIEQTQSQFIIGCHMSCPRPLAQAPTVCFVFIPLLQLRSQTIQPAIKNRRAEE